MGDDAMNIYVGNLDYAVEDADLRDLFAKFGPVSSARVIKDMYSGRSKGFGFVEIDARDAAEKAIAETNGTELKGRTLTVNEARPKNDSAPRSGGGGGGGRRHEGGGGGGGGGRRY